MEEKPTIERVKWYEAEKICEKAEKDQAKCIQMAAEVVAIDSDMTCKFMQDSYKVDNDRIRLQKEEALKKGLKSVGKSLVKAFTLGKKGKGPILDEKCTVAPVADVNYGKIDMI